MLMICSLHIFQDNHQLLQPEQRRLRGINIIEPDSSSQQPPQRQSSQPPPPQIQDMHPPAQSQSSQPPPPQIHSSHTLTSQAQVNGNRTKKRTIGEFMGSQQQDEETLMDESFCQMICDVIGLRLRLLLNDLCLCFVLIISSYLNADK